MLGGNPAILKLAMESVNFRLCDLHDYSACLLLIAKQLNFNFSGRKLFINSFIKSVIIVSFSYH